jgi:predicted nucleotidyltransferase
MTHYEQIESLKEQIVAKYHPDQIILFGSCAKGVIRKNSDIDLCIIKEIEKIREFRIDLQLNLQSEIPFDIVAYTPESWAKYSEDSTSFAYLIKKQGVQIHG